MIVFLTSWYKETDPDREKELITCLNRTCHSLEVDQVIVLAEAEPPFEHSKLKVIPIDSRPTYNDFFKKANDLCSPGDIIIISNTDIYPYIGTRYKLEKLSSDTCYALSRWDELPSGAVKLFDRRDSQDTWIFRHPIVGINGNFHIGVPGCDNRIMHEIEKAGYVIANPSKAIRFIHVHHSKVRNYTIKETIPGPYKFLHPHA